MNADTTSDTNELTAEAINARPDVATLTFEQAQAELEWVVEMLEDQQTGLDTALALWERGERLHAACREKLEYAAERIQQLRVDPSEVPTAADEHAASASDAATDSDAATAGDTDSNPDSETPAEAAGGASNNGDGGNGTSPTIF